MKILAIDTSTQFLCLGAYGDGKIYEYSLDLGRKHSLLLDVTVERVLKALGWKIEEVDYWACGLGPGSFTGLRVGLAAIKGFSWALHKPIVGFSTLDILAMNAIGFKKEYIIPALDAKRGLVYCAVYKENQGKIKKLTPYMLLSEKEFLSETKGNSIILGDALLLYKEKIGSAKALSKDYWALTPRNLIRLAQELIAKKEFSDAFKIEPIYLYPKECQIKK